MRRPNVVPSDQRFLRLASALALSLLGVAAEGCSKCKDFSSPGDNCLCADGSKAMDCKVKTPGMGGSPGGTKGDDQSGPSEEDMTAEMLKLSRPQDSAAYANDAITAEFFGCSRVGSSNDVLCVMDLIGSGYDWSVTVGGVTNYCGQHATAIDQMGREYRHTSVTLAGASGCGKTLVEKIKTEARIRFDDVHSGATTIALLKVPVDASATQENPPAETLMFRDVPLE
jgi:hypothetical protein